MFNGVLHCVSVLFLLSFWCPCMVINVSIQYNGGLLPDIILLTQPPTFVWFDGTIIVYYYYPLNYVSQYVLLCLMIMIGD